MSRNLKGMRFDRLLVIELVEGSGGAGKDRKWRCLCDCGGIVEVTRGNLTRKYTKSCGCLAIEESTQRGKTSLVVERLEEATQLDRFKGTKIKCISSTKIPKNNTSGVVGVNWKPKKQRWEARINVSGKRIYLGSYVDLADAKKARKEAEEKYFKPLIEEFKMLNEV